LPRRGAFQAGGAPPDREVIMVPAVAFAGERNITTSAPSPTRTEVLARYRHFREISKQHHNKILEFVSSSTLLQQARRIGISDGRRLILDSMSEFDLLSDLLVYTAPMGRSRAVDRYARNLPPAASSDEALVLDAMRNARFAILEMRRRHTAAGLTFMDDARNEEVWLIDLGFETWMEEGMLVATRYFTPDPFSMTCGVCIPLDGPQLLARTVERIPQLLRKRPAQLCDDQRFAEALYRTAIAEGVMERVMYLDPPAEGYAAA
jgi:hypothetical protein